MVLQDFLLAPKQKAHHLLKLTLQPDLEPNASKNVNSYLNWVALSFKYIIVSSAKSDTFNNLVPMF